VVEPLSVSLVERLVTEQFPQWAGRAVRPVAGVGVDHASFRLGDDLVVRLPRRADVAAKATVEERWLPVLASHLPVAVPQVVASGSPGDGYPFPWTVAVWIEGTSVAEQPGLAGAAVASDVAGFLRALRSIPASDGPAHGSHNNQRGGPASVLGPTFAAAERLGDVDADAIRRVGAEALDAPPWDGPPAWVHGDLHAGNVLVQHGRLAGVIDWSLLAVGDPAVDLVAAWTVFDADHRPAFRSAVAADEASWRRARGWALALAVNGMLLHRDQRPGFYEESRTFLADVLAD
jgi:aminoglycoside phosphotransferase (APT) family kinase protein